MGFSVMLPRYRKLLDKARCTLDTPAGDLRQPEKAAQYIWQRMTWGKQRRGYSYQTVLDIVKAQADVPEGRDVTSPELQEKLNGLADLLSGWFEQELSEIDP